jgi:thioredoxin-related protein
LAVAGYRIEGENIMTIIAARPGRYLFLAILLLVVSVSPAVADDQEKEDLRSIAWVGYNEGMALARDFDKPVFIHFTASWCKWCKKMKNETYMDPEVIRFMDENFVAVMVDTEKLPTLARKYGVESLPTLWFLDSQGNGLTNIQGYAGSEKLLRVLEYISTKAYEEIDYKTWVRKHPTH